MSAHDWTRARQRSVRRSAETEDSLAGEARQPASQPQPASADEELTEGEPFAPDVDPDPDALGPDVEPDAGIDVVDAQPVDAAVGEAVEEPQPELEPEEPAAKAPEEPEPPSVDAEPPAETVRAEPVLPREGQVELPLGLEPVESVKARKRTAIESREELIQRLLDPHLTLQETAKLLDVCPTTVRRYTNRGLLAHYRTPGNQRRFRLSDVLAFMERQGIPAHGLERKRAAAYGDDVGPEPIVE